MAPSKTGHDWTPSEIKQLKSMAGRYTARQIAAKLKRSEGAIRAKCQVEGFSLANRTGSGRGSIGRRTTYGRGKTHRKAA
jgi:hypothetical protein